MMKDKNNQRESLGNQDNIDDDDDDTYDYDEDETDDESDDESDGDRNFRSTSKSRQGSRSQEYNMKHTPRSRKESVIWTESSTDDMDCGGFDIIFTPVQYIQTLINNGCDDETVVIDKSMSSSTSSSTAKSGYEADKALHSLKRQLGEKSPTKGGGRDKIRSDDYKINGSPSSKTKTKSEMSSPRVDILDDSFYELDIQQKHFHNSRELPSVRHHKSTSESLSAYQQQQQSNQGMVKSALKSSMKQRSTFEDSTETISPRGNQSAVMKIPLDLSPIKKTTGELETPTTTTTTTTTTPSTPFNIDSFLEEISSMGMILSWHKYHDNSVQFWEPTTVRSFIEISDTLHPNKQTIWEPYFLLEELDTTGKHLTPLEKRRICLFDISSITRPTASALRNFPLACPRHCFLLTLSDGDLLLFESQTEADVKRIVLGLRWTIAKLSFNIVIGNPDMCEELLPLRRIKYSVKPVIVDSAELDTIMKSVTQRLLDSFQVMKGPTD